MGFFSVERQKGSKKLYLASFYAHIYERKVYAGRDITIVNKYRRYRALFLLRIERVMYITGDFFWYVRCSGVEGGGG